MRSKDVLLRWVELFNQGDAETIGALYHEDAINHQVANEPVNGKDAIYHMLKTEFANAEMHCIVENLFEDDDWAIMEWKAPLGSRGFGIFQIIERKIKFQRGYWNKLSFLKQHNLPIPK